MLLVPMYHASALASARALEVLTEQVPSVPLSASAHLVL